MKKSKKNKIKKGFLNFAKYIIIVGSVGIMNNGISQETINKIRNSLDIVDIVSRYVGLTPRGKNYFGICPFHDDNRPSMSVSKDKQIYKCFSCGATGNVFKFIMDYENISFLEAIKKCADMANISIDLKIKSFTSLDDKNKTLYEIYDNATKFYQNMINTAVGKDAKEYLKQRNINEDLIKEFKIGLSLKERTMLTQFLSNKGFNKNDLLKSGLILENNYGINDIYVERIMFPLEDLQGRVVGFSGRIYNKNDNSKYINTRETDIFKKGEILYNYARAKDEARNKGYVIVMEGFMDVIRSYTVGIRNTIAMMGTAVTKSQALTIKKMAKEIYLCFDGDKAGAHATMSCIDELIKIGVMPKIIRLEENLDPDEYILKYGKEKFLEKIDNPINVMDFKLSYLKDNKDISKSEELATYVNEVIKELSKIDDEVLREISIRKLSFESNLDIEFLKERLDLQKKEPVISSEIVVKKETKKLKGYEKAEQNLVYYMLLSKEVIKVYDNRAVILENANLRNLAREISAYYHKYGNISIADFITYASNYKDLFETLNQILNLVLNDDIDMNVINDYVNIIRNNQIDKQIEKLNKQIKEMTDIDKATKLALRIVELTQQKIS